MFQRILNGLVTKGRHPNNIQLLAKSACVPNNV